MDPFGDKPIVSCQVGQILDLVVVFLDEDGEVIPINDATGLKIRIAQPDGQVGDHVASLYTDGLDGAAAFRTTVDTFPFQGWFDIQGLGNLGGDAIASEVGSVFAKSDVVAPTGDIVAPVDIGTPGAEGSWRMRIQGVELIIETVVGGVYVESGRFQKP